MLINLRNALMAGKSEPAPAYWGLCFTAEEANVVVNMAATGDVSPAPITLKSSIDGVNWATFDTDTGTKPITLSNVGDKVYFKAGELGNERLSCGQVEFRSFTFSGRVSASGNIMSLLDGDNSLNTVISGLFAFAGLFYNCTSLISPPELPATTLDSYCYYSMFQNCSSLVSAPSLPATEVVGTCYQSMFSGCSSLVNPPPVLPAINAAVTSVYRSMFNGCSSLEKSPVIAAATVGGNGMNSMFKGCTNLKYIELTNMTSFPTSTRMTNWVSGVAATGTFKCPTTLGTNETIARGTNRCPAGWTVVNI